MFKKLLSVVLLMPCMLAFAQTDTKIALLQAVAKIQQAKDADNYQKALRLAGEKGWPLSFKGKEGATAVLVGTDDFGFPVYYTTQNNIIAAATTGANLLWNGGSSGLNLSGSSASVKDKMGIWDGGTVFPTHVELTGRVVQRDAPSGSSDHSTHVAGTMMASGVNPLAKGMAYGLQRLVAYDFTNHLSEILIEAPNLILSNHSYGTISGWYYNQTQSRWEFRGRPNENEDYKFGHYNSEAQLLDSVAYNAPLYLIVKSAGNNRNENGPAVGQTYWRFDATGTMINAGPRPAGISNNDGYDIVSTYGTAKNILTVGAVNGLPFGYTRKEDVVMSGFSSWGPTDDGRIKPDVVADGVNVFSCIDASATSYASYSGTSMATPNTTGSLLLLQEYYNQLHPGAFMRSATLKALTIHTANEAGPTPGPDYQHGWGLVNVAKAADVIKANNAGSHRIFENVLANGQTFTTTVVASGQGSLVATVAWTDPKAQVDLVNILNNSAKKLVNDLDIRITKGSTTYQPWVLNPAIPTAGATAGDNVLDNVERINVDDVIPGETYTVTITHKGALERSSQAYSLILSGVGGTAYCASAATSTTGTRIDSVSFGGIQKANPAGCTTYNNFTNVSAQVEPGQTLPLRVKVSSCDAGVINKIVKVFIDYNSNGSFADAGELVATSGVINGSGVFTANVGIPGLVAGNSSIMRVIAQDAATAADVNPCGAYANGETQDYKIVFAAPSNDLAVQDITSPVNTSCASGAQYLTVRVKNNGSAPKAALPLSVTVRNGATVVATLSGTYPATAIAGDAVSYTFQTTFATTPGTTYSVTAIVSDATDQNRSNDTLRTNITIAAAPATPAGEARICGTNAILRVTNPSANANYFWYSSATADNPIAGGASATTITIPANNTFYVGTGTAGNVGLTANSQFPNGGGYLTSNSANYMNFTATVPSVLETARLYTKYPGKVDFIVADITSVTGTGYTYQPISTTTVDVYATSPNPAPGAQAVYDPQDNGAIFSLNLFLPVGNHAIIVRPQGDANLFRNNNVTGDPYPFTLPGVVSFTGNSAAAPSNFQNFYYFLYNMRIRTTSCISGKGTVVATVAPTPTITQSNDSLVSSADAGNQWFLNGNAIAGATDKRYKPTQNGSYTVTVTDNFNCQRTSAAFNVVGTAINPVANASVDMKLSPNPNPGEFTLRFKIATREDLRIELINAQGQPVLTKLYPKFTGNFAETFRQQKLAAGAYVLRIQHGTKVYYNKLVVQH